MSTYVVSKFQTFVNVLKEPQTCEKADRVKVLTKRGH